MAIEVIHHHFLNVEINSETRFTYSIPTSLKMLFTTVIVQEKRV